ncbi:MAG TPA: enoyl-CoA hydratase/isomerase family protein [Dehalococcoidia bacterium]|nr:enoyl-CoA hydratase/isomerase family protein [Dehalococcoidia bacterium]
MAKTDYFIYEKDPQKRIARLTFNRPEQMNFIKWEDMQALNPLLREIEKDDDVKVLIVKGAGECFGAGADLTGLGTTTVHFSRDPKAPRPTVRERLFEEKDCFSDYTDKLSQSYLFHFAKATIAQVHGYCYGFHFGFAQSCDITIASEDALFTHPAFRYITGEQPLGVWLQEMGSKKYMEMVLTGRPFDAWEMEKMGCVNKVVPRERLDDEVNEMAEVIAKKPIELLVVEKHLVDCLKAMKNDLAAPNLVAALAHCAATHMKAEPGDFLVLKEVSQKGEKGAIDVRESRYPPKYRLSYKGRAAKE